MGPTAFRFHVEVADWLLMSVWRGLAAAHPVAPSYKYKGGWRNTQHTTPNSTHLSPLELEAFILDAKVD